MAFYSTRRITWSHIQRLNCSIISSVTFHQFGPIANSISSTSLKYPLGCKRSYPAVTRKITIHFCIPFINIKFKKYNTKKLQIKDEGNILHSYFNHMFMLYFIVYNAPNKWLNHIKNNYKLAINNIQVKRLPCPGSHKYWGGSTFMSSVFGTSSVALHYLPLINTK